MSLPSYKREILGKSPLRLVLGQIRFPLLFRFNEKPFLAPFQEAIQPDYPRVSSEQQTVIKFSAKGVEPTTGESLWRFSDRQRNWSVILGESALTLESRRYSDIDDFLGRFEKLLSAAMNHLGIEDRTRVGLRFVNELHSPDADTLSQWTELLNPKFVGYAGADLLDGKVEHAFHDIRCKRSDGTLVIRHGLLTGTTVEPRPGEEASSEQGRFYLIDFDYFDEEQRELDIATTMQQLRAYNESMYQLFRWALDKGSLYSQLDPRLEAR
jgi:uncharacterized protein (TIGR04255 family)